MTRVQQEFEQRILRKFPKQHHYLNKDAEGVYLNVTVFGAWVGWLEAHKILLN